MEFATNKAKRLPSSIYTLFYVMLKRLDLLCYDRMKLMRNAAKCFLLLLGVQGVCYCMFINSII